MTSGGLWGETSHTIFPEHRYRATIDFDAAGYERATASGIRLVSQFEVPDGRYQVRVATASGSARGSVVYDVEVPDFRDDAIALSGVSLAALSPTGTIALHPVSYRRTRQRAEQCRAAVCEAREVVQESATRSSRDERRESGGHGFMLALPLRDAAAGSYVLRVEATSGRDPVHAASRTIPIRIRAETEPLSAALQR